MAELVRGKIARTYFSSPTFTAGVLELEDRERIRFRGRFSAAESDVVALTGKWMVDEKYGSQFDASGILYELPASREGLVEYLAGHPAFKGVGEVTAAKLVDYAGDAQGLDNLLRNGIQDVHRRLKIPLSTLETLRDEWIAKGAENELRAYLAGLGTTECQAEDLLAAFGTGAIGVLKNDPYQLVGRVSGYGFKRVDKIARKLGVDKAHTGRIKACLLYCLKDAAGAGHIWTDKAELLKQADKLLVLDSLDAAELIREGLMALEAEERISGDGDALALPELLEQESLVNRVFREHGRRPGHEIPFHYRDETELKTGQLKAYATALERRISVISGGAGTGKTFVVARLAGTFERAGLHVGLCAPTGKAAKRIEELMREHGVSMPASTIHRMLGYNGYHFEVERLEADVVIVDEVSMVDVPLMAALFERIDFNETTVILVGDHNQLPPVGPGNILRDLAKHKLVPTVVLDEVVRQAGVLKINSMRVLAGKLAPTDKSGTSWAVVDSFSDPLLMRNYLRDLVLHMIPEHLGLDPVRDVQVLTSMHKGALGTRELNRLFQYLLHGAVERKFVPGDKVIQTVNDYELGVMNGTVGFVTGLEDKKYVIDFEGCGELEIGGEKLKKVQLAYALTAHKAQGSEFPCAVVVCHKSHFFADRNWLYTAVTRAARNLIVIGDRWGLRQAVRKNNTPKRRTFLELWAEQAKAPAKAEATEIRV